MRGRTKTTKEEGRLISLPDYSEHEWSSLDFELVLERLKTSQSGLSAQEVRRRRLAFGANDPTPTEEQNILLQFFSRFTNPLVLTLLIIAAFSILFGERLSGGLVAGMAFVSVLLSFIQEYRAGKTAKHLIDMVRVTTKVYRDNKLIEVPINDLVVGDIVELAAGDMIPADLRFLFTRDLYVNQATFTGESFPVPKQADPTAEDACRIGEMGTNQTISPKGPLRPKKHQCVPKAAELDNTAFMGSSVVSGRALAVVIKTGLHTELGTIADELDKKQQPTAFDHGVKKFTVLMIRFMLVLASAVFIINLTAKGNIIESFLFALAVAVGLAPEMLPMEVAINLSKGALRMSKKEVIVKRLDSMQNFGAMDILCTDKTGTLTQDQITLMKYVNIDDHLDEDVLRHAYIVSYYQTGIDSLLDRAVLKFRHLAVKIYKKLDEIPFDFERRVMSVVVQLDEHQRIITKGAPEEVMHRCTRYTDGKHIHKMNLEAWNRIDKLYDTLSKEGYRVLALGYRDFDLDRKEIYGHADESDLIFKGFVAFVDPAKPTAAETIKSMHDLGIELKILSGDNELVTSKICRDVELQVKGVLTGHQVEMMDNLTLSRKVDKVTIFCRLNPLQKERVIKALQRNHHTVGYMGDGINDAPALKQADVGISVNNAVGVAKDKADIILLRKSLTILSECVLEGRRTFGNIIKYIKMGSSSNFGNMLSMTGASFLLPFLPMLPTQILLNNFLYDFSQFSLPMDGVDEEYAKVPRQWNIGFIERYMVFLGPVSSIFDYCTFAVLWFGFGYNSVGQAAFFHTGWFLESLLSQTLVVYIIRTNKIPFLESWPSKTVIITTLSVLTFAFVVANTQVGSYLGFVPMPGIFFVVLGGMMILYLSLVQLVKSWFIKKFGFA